MINMSSPCLLHTQVGSKKVVLTNLLRPSHKKGALILHNITLKFTTMQDWCWQQSARLFLCALRQKVPNGLSRCHTKRRMGVRGHTHPSFGMTLTLQIFLNIFFEISGFFFFFLKSQCHTKGRMGARAIRDLFA